MNLVYDNIIFSLQKAGGISIYWMEIIQRFNFKNDKIIFYESENKNIFRKEMYLNVRKENFLSIKILRYLPLMKKLPSKSIFHSSYYRTSIQKDVVNIITVYDFTYEYYKTGLAKTIHSWQKKMAIKNADGIICISESTRKDLFNFLPNMDKKKVKTIYISGSEEFYKINNLDDLISNAPFEEIIEKKIILYVGDRKSNYKNFMMAVNIVSKLKDYILVSVGAGEITGSENKLINEQLNERFHHYTGISSKDLNILYNNSFCLLYPSTYEGFGIPILESMRAGCPVVSTNFSSIPEVAGNAGLLVDKISTNNFINEIKKLENEKFRLSCIDKGFMQASKFSWNKCFKETVVFYDEVYKRKFGKEL